MLILHKPWDSQPQEVVGVDDRTAAALNFAHWPKDVGGGSLATPTGTINVGVTGVGVLNPRGVLSVNALGENFSLIVVAVGGTAASSQNWLGNDTGAGRVWQFRMGTGSQVELIRFNVAESAFTAQSGAIDLTRPYVAIGTSAGTAVASYGGNIGSAPVTSGSATITGTIKQHTASLPIYVGSRDSVPNNTFTGTMYAYFVLPYAISAARAGQIIANPWQLFAPRSIWVPVSSSASGTSYTITPSGGVVLGGTSVDIKGKVLDVSGGVTLAGTGSMAFTSGGTTYTITPSGGVTLGGSATYIQSKTFTPSGGITLGGTSDMVKTKIIVPTDGVILGGTGSMTSNTVVVTGTVGERTKVGAGT